MRDLRIGFIGWGNIAEAMIKGLIRTGIARPENIAATGTRRERGEYLERIHNIYIGTENISIVDCVDVLVLSVKPQVASCIFAELHGRIPQSVLVMSVMAGISTEQLKEGLGTENIIRCMPNTPAKIGKGFTGWTATATVTSEDKEVARQVLASLGKERYFAKEDLLHAVTAASASAIAFVCEFIDALIRAAVHLGISWHDAREMILEVVKGTVALMEDSAAHPAILRDEVTSPGGTTTEGLRSLDEGRFRFTILEAVRAAYQKSIKLGEKQ